VGILSGSSSCYFLARSVSLGKNSLAYSASSAYNDVFSNYDVPSWVPSVIIETLTIYIVNCLQTIENLEQHSL